MVDLLAMWWHWPVIVRRYTGEGSNGPNHAAAVTILGKVSTKRKLVRNGDGEEVVSEARVSFPASTPLIPALSAVTLPPEFGGREATVIVDQLHHSGMDETPNFYSIDLT